MEIEESDEPKVCFVPFVKWVKRGVAKCEPEKVQLTKEELEEIIVATKNKLQISETVEGEESNIQTDNIVDEFNLEKYDEEEESADFGISSLAQLPTDEIENFNDDADSDDEDDRIKPEDNLILVTKIDGDASLLEVFVYNEVEGSLYCHHDLLLPSYPLALEWLDHEAGQPAGNYCAITVVNELTIDVWDLDVVNSLEPAYTLGNDKKAHKGDILDLSWNSNFDHILASCSTDKKIILWDLDTGEPATKLKEFNGNVTCIKWHHLESQTLLAGSADKTVKVFDCRNTTAFQTWEVNGEVEKICWNPLQPFQFIAATSNGLLAYFDCRKGLVWQLENAHTEEISGLAISTLCPGLLITTSTDGTLKTWDIPKESEENTIAKLIHEKDLKMGIVHTMQLAPELPFTVALGGNNKSHNFAVQNLINIDVVKTHFGDRQLIQLMEAGESSSVVQA